MLGDTTVVITQLIPWATGFLKAFGQVWGCHKSKQITSYEQSISRSNYERGCWEHFSWVFRRVFGAVIPSYSQTEKALLIKYLINQLLHLSALGLHVTSGTQIVSHWHILHFSFSLKCGSILPGSVYKEVSHPSPSSTYFKITPSSDTVI